MCRHLAYVGPPVTLEKLILRPEHSLLRQAFEPRHQTHGTINADGFGVGWYDRDKRPEPARYRTTRPIWADPSFASLAGLVSSTTVLAAVRSASPGIPVEESSTAPFTTGPWLFSHNGALNGWPAATESLAATLPAADLLALEARCDSALAWALVWSRLRAGCGPAEALAQAIGALTGHRVSGRFNFLLSNGEVIAATAAGDTLCYRLSDAGVLVASEPGDDEPGWAQVPDQSVLTATPGGVDVRPLPGPALEPGEGTITR